MAKDSLISAFSNQNMFNAVAKRYDLLNRLLSLGLDRYWRRQAVKLLAPCAEEKFLDIGAGTGDLAFEIVRKEPSAAVVGIDPAEKMLETANRKVQAGWKRCSLAFRTGDALSLEFEDDLFDGVVSAFCIRNLEDREKGFSEMARVLKPGGRMVSLELTKPPHPLVRKVHRFYNAAVVPFAGRILSREDAYRYLNRSIQAFPETDLLVKEIAEAGFQKTGARSLSLGIVHLLYGEKKEAYRMPHFLPSC